MNKRIWFFLDALFRFFRVWRQLLYGIWRISGLNKPIVSIFGGARFKQNDYYAQKAHELAQKFVNDDISVITGGGPGIMEAANCGAIYSKKARGKSIGIGVRDLTEDPNSCVQEYIELDFFFARKWLLTRYSTGFVVFPGGFGTMDELSEVITLMQTKKIPRVPIILVGVDYWQSFMQWVENKAFRHGLVSQEDLDLLFLTDDLEKTFELVCKACVPLKK
jgi:hypothetical protein